MTSRDKMLAAIKTSQPEHMALPDVDDFITGEAASLEKFTAVLEGIGGVAYQVKDYDEISAIIQSSFAQANRIVTSISSLSSFATVDPTLDPHLLENIDLAILEAQFAVAENSAVWLTDKQMISRVLPFISQYLAVVVRINEILPTMHHAYDKIGNQDYGFGAFIAGPSKTADIEQSLVLGAHGPKGMTVFLLTN
jgi:L-lactate dehydrogenase complex protein LldG